MGPCEGCKQTREKTVSVRLPGVGNARRSRGVVVCTAASFLLFLLLDTDCALIVDTIVKFIVVSGALKIAQNPNPNPNHPRSLSPSTPTLSLVHVRCRSRCSWAEVPNAALQTRCRISRSGLIRTGGYNRWVQRAARITGWRSQCLMRAFFSFLCAGCCGAVTFPGTVIERGMSLFPSAGSL